MLTLTITITERKNAGVGWTIEPGDQSSTTTAERVVGNLMWRSVQGIMEQAAKNMGARIHLLTIERDDKDKPDAA